MARDNGCDQHGSLKRYIVDAML
ncbi:uncharacterized protein METZ01_LOCUS367038 [marine metagenome]|uniref:Uncharacterized protein n=1 Tax=marine metagenome TaxID=408172 RepID=A0A382SWA7_9ZZZZ